jgi:hypothetical protein
MCQLDHAVGRRRACPGEPCAFWVDDHCAVAPFWSDFEDNPEVAEILSGLRTDLENRDRRSVLRTFHPPGLA